MESPIYKTVPLQLTPEMIKAVKTHPTTGMESREDWYSRLGWLICAWDVLLEAAPNFVAPDFRRPSKEGDALGETHGAQ